MLFQGPTLWYPLRRPAAGRRPCVRQGSLTSFGRSRPRRTAVRWACCATCVLSWTSTPSRHASCAAARGAPACSATWSTFLPGLHKGGWTACVPLRLDPPCPAPAPSCSEALAAAGPLGRRDSWRVCWVGCRRPDLRCPARSAFGGLNAAAPGVLCCSTPSHLQTCTPFIAAVADSLRSTCCVPPWHPPSPPHTLPHPPLPAATSLTWAAPQRQTCTTRQAGQGTSGWHVGGGVCPAPPGRLRPAPCAPAPLPRSASRRVPPPVAATARWLPNCFPGFPTCAGGHLLPCHARQAAATAVGD